MTAPSPEERPEQLTLPLRHGTVGRLSPAVSMGVVDVGADHATVQFFDAPGSTELWVGRPVRHAGLSVTLLEAHAAYDVRASSLLVGVTPDPDGTDGPDGTHAGPSA